MSEKKVHLYGNISTGILIMVVALLLAIFNHYNISFMFLFIIYLIMSAKWLTAKMMFYNLYGHKLQAKTIEDLKLIFNETDTNFSAEDLTVLGIKDDKYILGLHKLKSPNCTFEYFVVIDTGSYWFRKSSLPIKYNENSQNFINFCDGEIEFVDSDLIQIVHNGNKWNYILKEADIESVLRKVGIND